jgi:hypothetical protein
LVGVNRRSIREVLRGRMNSNLNACMEASDLPLREERGRVAVGGTQEVQSEMQGVEERCKGRW